MAVIENGEKKQKDYKFELSDNDKSYGFGHRHIQAVLVCILISVAFTMRVNVSSIIMDMTNNSTRNHTNVETYNWDKKTISKIFSTFFWGYTIMQIPGGYLAERFGAKALFSVAMLVNGVLTLLTPYAIYWGGYIGMCVCRGLQGMTQSCIFPGTMALASRWLPSQERSRLINIMFSGVTIGTIVGMPLSSNLSSVYGWPTVFYTIGCISIVYGIVWMIFGASNPNVHRWISDQERDFIIENIGYSNNRKSKKVPWKHVLTSVPFYALLIAQIGSVYVFTTMLMEIPTYFNQILGVDTKKSGIYSSLPYIGMWALSMIVGFISDWIINSKICSVINSRRFFNCCGTLIPAFTIIGLTFVPKNYPFIAIGLFVIVVSFLACINVGFMLSFIDIAPNYSGTMMGITNFISQAISSFSPIVVGAIVKDMGDQSQWQIVLIITASLQIISNLFYVIFVSADVQPWNNIDIDPEELITKKILAEEEIKMLAARKNSIHI